MNLTIGEQQAIVDRRDRDDARRTFFRLLVLLLAEIGTAVLLLMRG